MLHCSRKKADHISLSHYTYQHTGHQKFPYRLSVNWDAAEENDPLSLQGTPEYTRLTIGKPVNWQYISKVPNMTLRKQVLSYLFTDNSQFLMIYCQFLSISRREETDICNCQQPCQQSALPTEVLPLDEGAEIRRRALSPSSKEWLLSFWSKGIWRGHQCGEDLRAQNKWLDW